MTEMPYRWAKGPEWQMFELVLSAPTLATRLQHKRAVWKTLFGDDVPLADLNNMIAAETQGAAGQPVADAGVATNAAEGETKADNWEKDHLIKDWYGEDPREDSHEWYDNDTGGRGWWSAWTGQPMEIVRQAMLRALLVSLGISRTESECSRDDLDGFAPDHEPNWPIEFWWNCPVGNFQASVTWRRHPPDPAQPDSGVVSVAWMTPGFVDQRTVKDGDAPVPAPVDEPVPPIPLPPDCQCGMLRSDLRVVCGCAGDPPNYPKTDSKLDPVLNVPAAGSVHEHNKRRGTWIIGHTITKPQVPDDPETAPRGKGEDFTVPSPLIRSWGQVVTVEPSWPDGGVNESNVWGMY